MSFREINLTLGRKVEICQIIELTRSHTFQAIQQGTSHSNDYNVGAIRRNRKDFDNLQNKK